MNKTITIKRHVQKHLFCSLKYFRSSWLLQCRMTGTFTIRMRTEKLTVKSIVRPTPN